ncbi:hypothetical protein HPP92_013992 [Vanilla planifolia]|uniref:Cleavage inducing molecular chaperone Jiv domain-containing protein n=1 Tax=Vanilla planifolia TaxID=51239 RepID=A0A835QU41_VANPL|nr:hypothetical protein HPP92_013992 [Vanilla planifolia]
MGDIGLFRQGWKWFGSQKQAFMGNPVAISCITESLVRLIDKHWPIISRWSVSLWKLLYKLIWLWRDCVIRGFRSLVFLGSTPLFVILWSCLLSLTSTACIVYVLLSLGAAVAAICFLGYTPGLFMVGLFGILVMWKYSNFWAAGVPFIVAGYMFLLTHARPFVLMSCAYALYFVHARVGLAGVFLSLNFSFISNDLLNKLLQGCDFTSEGSNFEGQNESEPHVEDYPSHFEFFPPTAEANNAASSKSSVKTSIASNVLNFQKDASIKMLSDHFCYLKIDIVQVLSDFAKKKHYDEQLRKDESGRVAQRSCSTSRNDGVDFHSEESRRIDCTKCGNSHIWICVRRSKTSARWCQDCSQYHQAKDGDGWVEDMLSSVFSISQKVDIPRAFVCAESKVFDVSEWAICQGIVCKPNTHRPSFLVNMVGLDKATQLSNPSRYPWGLDAEMVPADDEFELWLQQALASGLFSDSPKRRKSWSPLKCLRKASNHGEDLHRKGRHVQNTSDLLQERSKDLTLGYLFPTTREVATIL